jgi:hypothetical protein
VNITAVVLAGENLALNILAGYVVYYSPGWIFPYFVFMLYYIAQTTLAATATSLTFLLRNPDHAIVVPRLSLQYEGAVEVRSWSRCCSHTLIKR